MAVVAKVYTPANIIQGPVDIYVGVQAPASAVPPVAGTNTLALDVSGQPPDAGTAGFHCGLAQGPAVLSITPKYEEIRADQFAAPIDGAFVSLETEIDVDVKETVLSNLQKYFTSPLGTFSALALGLTNPAADLLQIGSPVTNLVTFRTLLLIAPRHDVAQKFWYVLAYKCALKSAIAIPLGRAKETTYKLKFYCIADTTRVLQDQVLQIVRTL